MVPEAEVQDVLDELQRLRARVPLLTGALAASTDGLILAQDTPGIEAEGVAALTAAALGVSIRMTDATGRGGFRVHPSASRTELKNPSGAARKIHRIVIAAEDAIDGK